MVSICFFPAGGKPIDADQEMVALGICNFMSSFVQAMPIAGSFSRCAVNSASGVKTPLGTLWTGAVVLLTLALAMPYCAFIPKASLAAVIITAVIFMVDYEAVKPMWRSKSKMFSQIIYLPMPCPSLVLKTILNPSELFWNSPNCFGSV